MKDPTPGKGAQEDGILEGGDEEEKELTDAEEEEGEWSGSGKSLKLGRSGGEDDFSKQRLWGPEEENDSQSDE